MAACIRFGFGAALAALWILPAAAQNAPTFSVVVTEPSEVVEEVSTVRRIGRAEIEARQARTLDEALRLLSGVYVRTGGDGTPRIDIRGFRSRHVLLLVNGVQVNSSADGQFDPTRIPMAAVREIKVSYGNSSVLYGDNALAAVIEIATQDGRPDANVELNVGTPEQWSAGARIARTTGPWSFTLAATGSDTDGFRLPGAFVPTNTEDGERRENSDRDRRDIRGSVGYAVTPSIALGSEWSLGTGSYGLPPATTNSTTDIFAPPTRYERVEDYRLASGQVSVIADAWSRLKLRGWVYRNAQREDRLRFDDASYSSMDDPLVQGTFTSTEQTRVTGSAVLGRLDLQQFGWLRFAMNQRREHFNSSGVVRDVPTNGSTGGGGGGRGGGAATPTTYGVRSFALDEHVDVYSSGAEWELRPARNVGVVFGAAANWQLRNGSNTGAQPTWIAGVSYDATSALRLHASLTRKIRVPSIDQLYSASAGNPDLRPEHAYGVDAGIDHRLGAVSSVGLAAFVTRADDFIERVSGSPFENQERYRFAGAELTARTGIIQGLDVRGAYSFLDSADTSPAAENRALQTRPRHRGSLEWSWRPLRQSEIRGAAMLVGSQLFDSRGADPVQRRADGYVLLDVGFTQSLTSRYALAFDMTNVGDRLYDQAYALPREGRTALLTFRVRAN